MKRQFPRWFCDLLAFALCAAPALARAEHASFGAPGQWIVSGSVGAEVAVGSGASGETGTARDIALDVAPSVLAFVARGFATGVSLSAAYADRELGLYPYTEVALAIAPGCGFNLPLAEAWSLFPQLWVGLGYARQHYAATDVPVSYYDPSFATAARDDTLAGWFATVQLPLPVVWRFGAATYAAIGPRARLRVPFGEGTRLFSIGLTAGLGGFF